jgi:hypothetical protein
MSGAKSSQQQQQRNQTGVQNMNLNGEAGEAGDGMGKPRNNNPMSPQMRQASFKSTSSSSTTQGGPNSLRPNHLSTPRASPRKNSNRSGGGRQLPRRPGEANTGGNDYDSDENSDYQYDNYNNQGAGGAAAAHQDNQYNQPSDDENEDNRNNEENGSNENESGGGNTRNNNKQQDEQEKVNALALAAETEAMKEQELHKRKLQIYVFVCRCIAYPFIAKQPTDMVRRQLKITKQQLETIKDNFNLFLQNKMSTVEADEAFTNAVRSYYEVFLKSDRVAKMVGAGGCTAADFRDVFKNNIEKRVRSLPEIDGLSKETVFSSWMAKFDSIFRYNEEHISTNVIAARRHSRTHLNQGTSECILSKEQLYEMFQNILGVKKFEHQLIFNAAQVTFFIFLLYSDFERTVAEIWNFQRDNITFSRSKFRPILAILSF